MHISPLDVTAVDRIWDAIVAAHDSRLDAKLEAVRKSYTAVKSSPAMRSADHDLIEGTGGREVIQMVIAILLFVARACDYFDSVRTYRQLTDQEKQIGHELSSLLTQSAAALPKLGTT